MYLIYINFFDTTIKVHVCHRVYFWNYLNYFDNGSSNSWNAYNKCYFSFISLFYLHPGIYSSHSPESENKKR